MEDFEAYVSAAWPRLLRSAWLLTHDWHRAEDLVQAVLARGYSRWPRIRDGAPDAYFRAMLASTYLSWWRRRWRGELPTEHLPERPAGEGELDGVELRHLLAGALSRLPRQQRAVLMLRFHGDFTEADTAQVLGLRLGTVKSHTSRALTALRHDPQLRALLSEGVDR